MCLQILTVNVDTIYVDVDFMQQTENSSRSFEAY